MGRNVIMKKLDEVIKVFASDFCSAVNDNIEAEMPEAHIMRLMRHLKAMIYPTIFSSLLLLTGCGDGGGSLADGGIIGTGSITGTVPGTTIEAFGDQGEYFRTASEENNTDKHPFLLQLPAGVGFYLVMIINEDSANEVVMPIAFPGKRHGDVLARITLQKGDVIDLGHIPLFMNCSDVPFASDPDQDCILDKPFILNEAEESKNPLRQMDADDDGLNDYDDEDHGYGQQNGWQHGDPQDHDDDRIPNIYDDDFNPESGDEDEDGIEDDEDENPGNVPEDDDDSEVHTMSAWSGQGMHPVNQAWRRGHDDYAEHNIDSCASCHGDDFRGTPSSAQVGCYDCHDGPEPDDDFSSYSNYENDDDQNCDGSGVPCTGGTHAGLTYNDYPQNCLGCHDDEAHEVKGTTHYNWTGSAPDMVNGPDIPQGKLTNGVNSYCINIKGNWPVCGSCHAGRGKRPDDPTAGLDNIDCLACHNEEYARARKRLPGGAMGVENPTDSMVQNIHAPTRANCLMCHAKAGGGDGVKRGDLSLATITNNDPHFDVHMNSSGSDLSCQQCHEFEAHRVIGKGSDLRPTDDTVRGSEIACVTCHEGKDTTEGHDENIARHVDRVACQTCHIPTYAKVATETHRDWRLQHDGESADGLSGPGHPYTIKESNLIPEYKFWNRLSDNYLLGDDASLTYDAEKNTYPTSRPLGDIHDEDSKLYPFKYKTATQPKTSGDNVLIALDTFEYLKGSGNVTIAVEKGLEGMGYGAAEPYEWVDTDTYQLLNHGVSPASEALQCSSCHGDTTRLDLQGELGYGLKGDMGTVCTQCHGSKGKKSFLTIHDKHVKDKRYDCSWCHAFSRPERNLRMP